MIIDAWLAYSLPFGCASWCFLATASQIHARTVEGVKSFTNAAGGSNCRKQASSGLSCSESVEDDSEKSALPLAAPSLLEALSISTAMQVSGSGQAQQEYNSMSNLIARRLCCHPPLRVLAGSQ